MQSGSLYTMTGAALSLLTPMPAYAMDLAISQPNLSLLPIGGVSVASGFEAVRNYLGAKAEDDSDKSYDQLLKEAIQDNRVNTVKETMERKFLGAAMLFGVSLGLIFSEDYRNNYGQVSFGVASAIGLWRTGNQGL